jgi:hypothetical protein
MRSGQRIVWVNGISFPVERRSTYLKADMHGVGNWDKVWAETEEGLVRNIKRALSGKQ